MGRIGSVSLVVLTAVLIGGCARPARRPPATSHAEPISAAHRQRATAPAAALAFSPPMLQDMAPLDLSRDERQPAAFVGFPEGVAEFFYVRWDDRQTGGDGLRGGFRGGFSGSRDRYERRAISEKSGVLFR